MISCFRMITLKIGKSIHNVSIYFIWDSSNPPFQDQTDPGFNPKGLKNPRIIWSSNLNPNPQNWFEKPNFRSRCNPGGLILQDYVQILVWRIHEVIKSELVLKSDSFERCSVKEPFLNPSNQRDEQLIAITETQMIYFCCFQQSELKATLRCPTPIII